MPLAPLRRRTRFVTPFRGCLATLTAACIAVTAAAPDAHAYVVKRTSKGELVHWEQRNVDYAFDPSVGAYVTDAVEATLVSMQSWSSTVGAPELHGHAAANFVDAPTKPGFDQKNGVFYMPTAYAPAGRALAITVLTYDNASGRILDADIIVNGAYKFAVLPEHAGSPHAAQTATGPRPSNTDGIAHEEEPVGPPDTVYDLHHVVAHEIGHTLGMNDELALKDALMYRYSAPNDATIRAPGPDDIAGLAELYSMKLDGRGNGCGNATVAPTKPSAAASHLAMIATLGLLVFVAARGRNARRTRFAFAAATVIAGYAFFPRVSTDPNASVAHASAAGIGHARAKILHTTTTMEDGLFKTSYDLATTACKTLSCPKTGKGFAWGGAIGDIHQDVGGQFAPENGDEVDVSFAKLPSALAPLSRPFGEAKVEAAEVRMVTRAILGAD